MPIYEYVCENCEHELEVIQKFSDKPLTLCPSCKQETLSKKTSMTAFHLKGGGWYKDGYSNGSSAGANASKSADSSSASTSSASSETSSTTKSTSDSSSAKETKPQSKAS